MILFCLLAALPGCGNRPASANPAAIEPGGQVNSRGSSQEQPTPTPADTPFRRPGRGPVTPTATATIEAHFRPPTPTPVPIKPVLAATPVPQISEPITLENASDLIELARWGKGEMQQILWSPDGRWLAAAFTAGIVFYDSLTLDQVGWIDLSTDGYTSLAFSPDGSQLVVGMIAGETQSWSVPKGDSILAYPELSWRPGNSLAYTNRGESLVSSTFMDVSIWRADNAGLVYNRAITNQGFSLSPDGTQLAIPESDELTVHSVLDGSFLYSVQLQGQVNALAYTPDGKTIAAAVEDEAGSQSVQVLNASDGSSMQSLSFVGKPLAYMAFSPDGLVLAAWTKGNEDLQFWKAPGWESLLRLQDRQFTFSPDGSLVATWTFSEPDARVYRTSNGLQAYLLPGHQPGVRDIVFASFTEKSDENALVTISGSGNLRLWSAKNGSLIKPLGEVPALPDRSPVITGIATNTRNPVFAAQMVDGSLKLFNAADGSLVKTITEAPQTIDDLAFDPGGKTVSYRYNERGGCRLNASDGSLLDCFSASSGKKTSVLTPDGGAAFLTPDAGSGEAGDPFWIKDTAAYSREIKLTLPFSLTLAAFPGDGKTLLLASPYGEITRFNVKDGSRASRVKLALVKLGSQPVGDDQIEILRMVASPDGQELLTATSDGSLNIWKTADGSLRFRLDFPQGAFLANPDALTAAFSPDGSMLAVGLPDLPVKIYNLKDGALERSIDVDAGYARLLVFLPGNQILMSGAGGHIKLSKIVDGSELARLQALSWITGLAVSPDGRLVATVTEDGVIQIWGVRPKK